MRPLLLPLVLGMFLQYACGQAPATFADMLQGLYKNTVPVLSSQEVQQRIESGQVRLLDARERDEYEVSHLPHAVYLGYNSPEWTAALRGCDPRQTTVIIYCSVGYRSERMGEALRQKGYQKVYHLYGGIFDWVNQGREVVNAQGRATKAVHPYNESWGKWLIKGEKRYKP